jgi:hypothetical protein
VGVFVLLFVVTMVGVVLSVIWTLVYGWAVIMMSSKRGK